MSAAARSRSISGAAVFAFWTRLHRPGDISTSATGRPRRRSRATDPSTTPRCAVGTVRAEDEEAVTAYIGTATAAALQAGDHTNLLIGGPACSLSSAILATTVRTISTNFPWSAHRASSTGAPSSKAAR